METFPSIVKFNPPSLKYLFNFLPLKSSAHLSHDLLFQVEKAHGKHIKLSGRLIMSIENQQTCFFIDMAKCATEKHRSCLERKAYLIFIKNNDF